MKWFDYKIKILFSVFYVLTLNYEVHIPKFLIAFRENIANAKLKSTISKLQYSNNKKQYQEEDSV